MRNACRVVAGANSSAAASSLSMEAERFAGKGADSSAALGRDHPALLAHQQRIVEDDAQPLQRDADRRLRLVELDRRARHAALGEERAQHAQR